MVYSFLKKFVLLPILVVGTSAISLVGCASGGFKLTRQYARFINKQTLIVRVILYILLGVGFAVTLAVDGLIFNTIDFWEGRVSASDHVFENEDHIYHVQHRLQDGLRETQIRVSDNDTDLVISRITLRETKNGVIQILEDGVVRAEVSEIQDVLHVFGIGPIGVQKIEERLKSYLREDHGPRLAFLNQ